MKKFLTILLSCALLSACSDNKPTEHRDGTMTINQKTLVTPLYFSGTVQPIKLSTIVSAVDGVVIKRNFSYGQSVKKGDILFEISSTQLQQDLHSAVSEYIKAVDDYEDKKRKFEGSKELRRLQFISDDDYFRDKNAAEESNLALIQSKFKLEQLLSLTGNTKPLEDLHLRDQNTIHQFLSNKKDKIFIKANHGGIALFPIKTNNNNKIEGEIQVGSEIKKGQVLLNIGDLSGLAVDIKVNETNVNQIKPGQKVTVTGSAFSGLLLHGKVDTVDAQGKAEGAALPTFPVRTIIPKITDKDRKVIHVGMSAKVEISLEEKSAIIIPITAVSRVNNQAVVKLKDKQSGEFRDQVVKTGKTTLDKVVILSGLKSGDTIATDY